MMLNFYAPEFPNSNPAIQSAFVLIVFDVNIEYCKNNVRNIFHLIIFNTIKNNTIIVKYPLNLIHLIYLIH